VPAPSSPSCLSHAYASGEADFYRLCLIIQFLDTFESLVARVERLRSKDPKGYRAKNSTKRLAAVVKLAFDIILESIAQPSESAEQTDAGCEGGQMREFARGAHSSLIAWPPN